MTKENGNNGSVRKTWRLRNILGIKVLRNGRKIGRLDDLIFAEGGPIPTSRTCWSIEASAIPSSSSRSTASSTSAMTGWSWISTGSKASRRRICGKAPSS